MLNHSSVKKSISDAIEKVLESEKNLSTENRKLLEQAKIEVDESQTIGELKTVLKELLKLFGHFVDFGDLFS